MPARKIKFVVGRRSSEAHRSRATTRPARTIGPALLALACLNYIGFGQALATDPAPLFSEKCAGCHTIGGGNLVGPDLAPAAKWGSSDLSKAIIGMEKNVGPLTSEEIEGLVEYIKSPKRDSKQDATTTPSSPHPGVETAAMPIVEPASASRGERLFSGAESLKNGGLSCIACHQVDNSGGTMGPNLTGLQSKMTGPAIVAACEHTPYKVMKEVYKEHALTHQEALDLAEYFTALAKPHSRLKEPPVTMIAFLIAGFVLVIIAFGYRNRNGSMRAKLKRRD
ncbi:MAG: c-type cytochrome [Cyanobacteria bacterium SZAS LIN-3]|nr:c-type cytochrome [Cyanobacteria bacterium SZAS LIN-3]MBS2006836.1 c-type cytochrome [Cyanobacteria bacterium SZAS TMP-1]